MNRTGRWFATLVALAVVAAACAGDGADDGASDTTGAATTTVAPDDTAGRSASDVVIRIGLLADRSGVFAGVVNAVVEAQQVYFDLLNANGGIDGRPVELLIEDTSYDVAVTQEKYELLRDQVVMFSHVTGSPPTAAIAPRLVEDHLVAIPFTWYSGWAFGEPGRNVYETYTNYCMESMNAVTWMKQNRGVKSIAIVSFPGEFGADGAAGARLAADALGLEVVYDGDGALTVPTPDDPDPDQTEVIAAIVEAEPDLVWVSANPGTLSTIMEGAAADGFEGGWSGNAPTYSSDLLDTDVAPLLDRSYTMSSYHVAYGTEVAGMSGLVDAMRTARPDLPVSDAYVLGWTEAQVAEAMLRGAAATGEVTPESVEAAAAEIEVDFEGLAPAQTWSGDPNDVVVRESYLYDVSLADYHPATLGERGGSTGSVLLDGPYTSGLAAKWDFTEPCATG